MENTWTIERTTFYKDDGSHDTHWIIAPTTYQAARSELAYVRRLYRQSCKETRFNPGEYGYAGKYANHLFKLLRAA